MCKIIYHMATVVAALLLFTGCGESLEDTYKDMAGDGKIRYLAGITDLSVEPGWERLQVSWTPTIDPMVEKTKIVWSSGVITNEAIVDKAETSYSIDGLVDDLTYEVIVTNLDAKGNSSLVERKSGRPYTEGHENILLFTRGIMKTYALGDNLVVFFDLWSSSIVDFKLKYYDSNSDEQQTLQMTRDVFDQKWMLIENIKTTDPENYPITIERIGSMPGVPEQITFKPYHIETSDRVFSSELREMFERDYGIKGEITDEFVNGIETLDFDLNISSFADVLYFPNLVKINLGGNRYLRQGKKEGTDDYYADDPKSQSVVDRMEESEFILKVAQRMMGLEIDQYNHHFFPEGIDDVNITSKGNPVVPLDIQYFDTANWTITNSVEGADEPDAPLKDMLDDNPATFWSATMMPYTGQTGRSYNIEIDMQNVRSINGFKVVQKSFGATDLLSSYFTLPQISVEYSTDLIIWQKVTYMDNIKLGATNGESTIVNLPAPVNARYVRLRFSDRVGLSGFWEMYSAALADFALF